MNDFTAGEQLIIRPINGDDPEANQRAGSTCIFIRYADAPGKLSRFAVVRYTEKGHNVYLRSQDLAREAES